VGVLGEEGVSDFDRLRAAIGRLGSRDAFLYAFDLLEINGEDLRRYEWQVRRGTLTSLLRKAPDGVRLSEHLADIGRRVHVPARLRAGSRRHRRQASGPALSVGPSTDWIKVKNPGAPAATRILEWT